MKERIQQLLAELNRGLFEKESEVALSLLAAIAGQSVILLGPPGVAKSMVARRLKRAFAGGRAFEYLMSRFSTPDEIFGPVSISKLKSCDSYERVVDGYLPTADVVFLDEIWKAGPAIQNTLLTVINEKVFRNGNRLLTLPLKLLVAASNELPAKGEGLEALWDRFIIRVESRPIATEAGFDAMFRLRREDELGDDVSAGQELEGAIRPEEYARWAGLIDEVEIGDYVLSCIHSIRKSLRQVSVDETEERRDIYVSDRRWRNIARLLRTSAFTHDRRKVILADLLPIYHCLWQEPDERDAIRRLVISALFSASAYRLADIKQAVEEDIRYHRRRVEGRLAAGQRDYEAEIEQLSEQLSGQEAQIKAHLYVSKEDLKELQTYLTDFYRAIAFTRQDVSKLYE
ncbi:AAA family ATPase [Prevotella sp.]|uniref:AAA family ATPase n=1 Tax=Prevotella sp. TaxID=59823 RepID=UPI0039C92AB1